MHLPYFAATCQTEVVPLQMSQYVSWILPTTRVSAEGTEPAVKPLGFITAKEHPVYWP